MYIYIYMCKYLQNDTSNISRHFGCHARRLGNPCRTSWTLPPWSLRVNASGANVGWLLSILDVGVSENSVPLKPLVNDHSPY